MKFILASASPRRKELLPLCYKGKIDIIPTNIDESSISAFDLEDYPQNIAIAKLKPLIKDHKDAIILSADTMVYLNGKKYGKPKDFQEAYKMLDELQGKVHEVITGFALYKDKKIYSGKDISYVEIAKMNKEDIENYINTGSPFDKAGGYGIQDEMLKAKIVKGSYYNVMGLPVERLQELFKEIGL